MDMLRSIGKVRGVPGVSPEETRAQELTSNHYAVLQNSFTAIRSQILLFHTPR